MRTKASKTTTLARDRGICAIVRVLHRNRHQREQEIERNEGICKQDTSELASGGCALCTPAVVVVGGAQVMMSCRLITKAGQFQLSASIYSSPSAARLQYAIYLNNSQKNTVQLF